MVYCEQCGAANDIMNQQCHRCGHNFVPLEPLLGQNVLGVMAPSAVLASNGVHGAESAAGISAGLELPEWLQRAAAETPEAQAHPIDLIAHPTTFEPAPETRLRVPASAPAGGLTQPGFPRSSTAPQVDPVRQLPPVPPSGTSSTMPEWLRTGQPPILRATQTDAADTTSFISESDLPEWIRQIGEADAAKRVEEERIAAESIRIPEESTAGRTLLPGESMINESASNPWLSRKETPAGNNAWTGAAETPRTESRSATSPHEDSQRPEVIQVIPETTATATRSRSKRGIPSVKIPSIAIPKLAISKPATDSGSQMIRYVLIGAIALLLIFVLVMVVL